MVLPSDEAPRPALPVILIGPVNAGKSAIARRLAPRIGVERCSLDQVCWEYYRDAGFDPAVAAGHLERGGRTAEYAYVRRFYPGAVERVLAECPQHVIDLGAGHTVLDEPELFGRVQKALAPYPNVVLLLPSDDQDESIRLLAARQGNPRPDVVALNERFVRHPANALLAKITVYTKGRTPAETCENVVARLSP